MAFLPFAAAFIFIFLSEIADKTQLVILGLALRFKKPMPVFLGALTAHSLMDLLAIVIGVSLPTFIPAELIERLIAIIFIAYGTYLLYKIVRKHTKKKKEKHISAKAPFAISFLTILLSEFGDKTQVASGLLAARYTDIIFVFLGTVVALVLAIGLNVFVGSKVAERLPRKAIKVATALLFIAFGIGTLIF